MVMSVLNCSRTNCDHIMCDTYVDEVGYICNDCQEEFKEYMESKFGCDVFTEGIILEHLKEFMETRKSDNRRSNDVMSINGFFEKNTR